ncbi:hypothetical protein ZHAS_00017464 [Anopheles sinensis]|uniref:Uncharacterized protein n=1 Tax=Anopheles sinensis TaxID=74873 RepID=A0A084WGM3_ANOSI|nr:hypothetical protein ZHAS_00017464 [Anopheles sinensis]
MVMLPFCTPTGIEKRPTPAGVKTERTVVIHSARDNTAAAAPRFPVEGAWLAHLVAMVNLGRLMGRKKLQLSAGSGTPRMAKVAPACAVTGSRYAS